MSTSDDSPVRFSPTSVNAGAGGVHPGDWRAATTMHGLRGRTAVS